MHGSTQNLTESAEFAYAHPLWFGNVKITQNVQRLQPCEPISEEY